VFKKTYFFRPAKSDLWFDAQAATRFSRNGLIGIKLTNDYSPKLMKLHL
jgi:hypothetical protein